MMLVVEVRDVGVEVRGVGVEERGVGGGGT